MLNDLIKGKIGSNKFDIINFEILEELPSPIFQFSNSSWLNDIILHFDVSQLCFFHFVLSGATNHMVSLTLSVIYLSFTFFS